MHRYSIFAPTDGRGYDPTAVGHVFPRASTQDLAFCVFLLKQTVLDLCCLFVSVAEHRTQKCKRTCPHTDHKQDTWGQPGDWPVDRTIYASAPVPEHGRYSSGSAKSMSAGRQTHTYGIREYGECTVFRFKQPRRSCGV